MCGSPLCTAAPRRAARHALPAAPSFRAPSAAKLYWTLASRRVHKKLNTDASAKKRARRVVKVQRGYVGAEKIEEIKKKNLAMRPAASATEKTKSGTIVQAAIAEAKAKQKAAQAARKAAGGAKAAAPAGGAKAAAKHAGKGR